jgi:septal ring factor EnvC (AmiA/AmiB activator)
MKKSYLNAGERRAALALGATDLTDKLELALSASEQKIKELEKQLEAERKESLATEKELFRTEKQLAEKDKEILYWQSKSEKHVAFLAEKDARWERLAKAVSGLEYTIKVCDDELVKKKEVLELIKGKHETAEMGS